MSLHIQLPTGGRARQKGRYAGAAYCPPGDACRAAPPPALPGGSQWQWRRVWVTIGGMVTCHPIGPHLDTAALHSGIQAGMRV